MINLKRTPWKMVLAFAALVGLCSPMFPLWYHNSSEISYLYLGETGGSAAIAGDIAGGAGFFLASYAGVLELMRITEVTPPAGLDYGQLRVLVDQALSQAKEASALYLRLHRTAAATPYNPEVIQALQQFPYEDFRKANGLNRDIFARVQAFLEKGDVTGIYAKTGADMESIIRLLTEVKADIDKEVFPAPAVVRRLNQAFGDALLFGQYVAGIFAGLAGPRLP